jgi:asparagine synthase (glutamine-hydrolysing)
MIESLHRSATWLGFERRYPFLDMRLVRFVLGIPLEYRLRHPYLRLPREALASLLPDAVVRRQGKAEFSAAVVRKAQAGARLIEETLAHGPWRAEPWLDRRACRALADRVLKAPVRSSRDYETVSKITALERWLRDYV